MKLTEADANRTFEIHPGQILELTLDDSANGYQWQMTDSVDPAILQPVEDQTATPKDSVPGSPTHIDTKTVLRFKAVSSGQTTLDLIYQRPFELRTAPLQTYTVTITVK